MSSEDDKSQSADGSPALGSEEYFKKLAEFTEKQQEKVAKVIDEGAKVMADFKPFAVAEDINTHVDALVKTVDEQLTKAMEKVNEQMKQINEKTK